MQNNVAMLLKLFSLNSGCGGVARMFYVPLTFVAQLSLTAASSSGSASSSESTGADCDAFSLGASGGSGAPLSGWKWRHIGP